MTGKKIPKINIRDPSLFFTQARMKTRIVSIKPPIRKRAKEIATSGLDSKK